MTSTRPGPREIFISPENRIRVYFYTSNTDKFSQAFTLFQRAGLVLSYFRSKLDPYSEDYSSGSQILLERALSEIRQSVGATSLFFVEDTSLRIEALSTGTNDVPGLAVKEWFASTTFDELDRLLNEKAASRTAIVRSDIALHVPGLTRPVFFTSQTSGVVADQPPGFPPSSQYPWLTPDTFNGWFVPHGSTKRLGEMNFEESLQYDFRAKCLDLVIDRIEEYSAVLNLPPKAYSKRRSISTRNQLQLFAAPALIIVGPPCSGKTTFGERSSLEHSLRFIEASSVMRSFRSEFTSPEHNLLSDFAFAELVLETLGSDAVARKIVDLYGSELEHGFVISGFRTVEEVQFITSRFPETQVVLVEANERIRFQRCLERGRSPDMTLASFRQATKDQESLGLLPIAQDFADFQVVNEGTLEDYYQQISSVVSGRRWNLPQGISSRIRPRHQKDHNQLYRSLAVLEYAGRPLNCDEIEAMTSSFGIAVLANNANKVLKRFPGFARRLEMDGSLVRYEILNAGRDYLRKTRQLSDSDGEVTRFQL